MIPEIIKYKIKSERQQNFLQTYSEAGEFLKKSTDCLGYDLIQSNHNPERYLLMIYWDSQEGRSERFLASELFSDFFTCMRPFVDSITEMEHYQCTDLAWHREPLAA